MTDRIARLTAALDGHYRIERELGEGGMATVYLADDLKHERKVALKVLKPELAAVVGAERFLTEIKTTANLQHPHILPLFDSGEADSFLFYVMPYIEGETLRDRLDREKQLPLDEALYIATSIANALQTAHDAGIIHRDIKPGNILLSRGEPLVGDFGIALAVGAAGGNRLTETGLSVGTPYYMSPEQATGDQEVGPASDIFALACVLYEMLVGEPPYPGSTAQAVLGKIIQGLPVSATAARKAVPLHVDAAIRRALEKLPADRFTSAAAFARALADPTFRHGDEATSPVVVGRWRAAAMASAAVAVLATLVAAAGWMRSDATEPVRRQAIAPIGEGLPRPLGAFTALAPDGSSMVYARPDADAGSWRLWLKPQGSAEPSMLPFTERAQNATYSPDGRWIAYVTANELRKRPVGDGSAVTLAEDLPPNAATSQVALAWLDDGTLVYEMPGPTLMRIGENGGAPDTVAVLSDLGYPQFGFAGALPGSQGVLVTVCSGTTCGTSVITLGVLDFAADTLRPLVVDAVRGWYTPTGHLMYVRRDGAVFAAPFDLDALELSGPGFPLFAGVSVTVTSPEMVVAWDGTVLYGTGVTSNDARQLVWVDRQGGREAVDPGLDPSYRFRTLSLSPTQDRIALTATGGPRADPEDTPQLYVKELPSGPLTLLTADSGYVRRPVWAPDGRSIAYVTNEAGSFEARSIVADGSSATRYEVLLSRERTVLEVLYGRGGEQLVFREGDTGGTAADVGLWNLETGEASMLLTAQFNESEVALSPDERWLAYTADASGGPQVFVRPFPGAQSQVQVSTATGMSPVFAHNGRELFYVDEDDRLVVATYETQPTFRVTDRRPLFALDPYIRESAGWRGFDVSQDDERFLMIYIGSDVSAETTHQVLIQNFWTEVVERVGG